MRDKIAEIIKDNTLLNSKGPVAQILISKILALFPDLSVYEVEVECTMCNTGIMRNGEQCGCNAGKIRIPLAQFIAEGRSEGKVIKKEGA